jgi:phosphoribosylformylglycinamidine synthase
LGGLHNLGLSSVGDVRIGKHIDVQIEATSKEEAHQIATEAAVKLLSNQVMENFEVTILS